MPKCWQCDGHKSYFYLQIMGKCDSDRDMHIVHVSFSGQKYPGLMGLLSNVFHRCIRVLFAHLLPFVND
jgi:hypothetical protein